MNYPIRDAILFKEPSHLRGHVTSRIVCVVEHVDAVQVPEILQQILLESFDDVLGAPYAGGGDVTTPHTVICVLFAFAPARYLSFDQLRQAIRNVGSSGRYGPSFITRTEPLKRFLEPVFV